MLVHIIVNKDGGDCGQVISIIDGVTNEGFEFSH